MKGMAVLQQDQGDYDDGEGMYEEKRKDGNSSRKAARVRQEDVKNYVREVCWYCKEIMATWMTGRM